MEGGGEREGIITPIIPVLGLREFECQAFTHNLHRKSYSRQYQ